MLKGDLGACLVPVDLAQQKLSGAPIPHPPPPSKIWKDKPFQTCEGKPVAAHQVNI